MIKVKTDKLRKAIYSKGYSFRAFALLCGKSHGSLTNIFERRTISAEFAKKICDVLNEDFSIFFESCGRNDSG